MPTSLELDAYMLADFQVTERACRRSALWFWLFQQQCLVSVLHLHQVRRYGYLIMIRVTSYLVGSQPPFNFWYAVHFDFVWSVPLRVACTSRKKGQTMLFKAVFQYFAPGFYTLKRFYKVFFFVISFIFCTFVPSSIFFRLYHFVLLVSQVSQPPKNWPKKTGRQDRKSGFLLHRWVNPSGFFPARLKHSFLWIKSEWVHLKKN